MCEIGLFYARVCDMKMCKRVGFTNFFRLTRNKLPLIQIGYIVLSFDKFSGNTSGTRTRINSFPQKGQNRLATLFSSMMDSDLNVISKEFAPGNEQL